MFGNDSVRFSIDKYWYIKNITIENVFEMCAFLKRGQIAVLRCCDVYWIIGDLWRRIYHLYTNDDAICIKYATKTSSRN